MSLLQFFFVDLYHLIYQSQALGAFGAPELATLLHRGRAHNQANGISGVLLHTPEGRFLQVLEGPQTAVRHLYYHVILSDARHFHCQVLGEGFCAQRSFAGWTMGCRVARPADLRALLGEAPPDGLGLVHRPYPRFQLLALLEAFVVQDAAETDLAHPLDSRPTRHF
ncbi:hypothetical protein DDQ68_03050 [Hymenobacter nivis]|uniref:BLUF domain-containing protein n=1 Tax=Hymenobacter nivis TaxID=1850093 RepID=A0A2Z3GIV5_9BACT|nr:hypothetical protein DDQ68_03050 [Hymenobacter nivis]